MKTHNYYVVATKLSNGTLFKTKSFNTIYGLTMKVNDLFEEIDCEILLSIYDNKKEIGFFQESFEGLVAVDFDEKILGDR